MAAQAIRGGGFMKIHDIDKALYQTEARKRKEFLIRTLRSHDKQDRLGRELEDLRLPELEWLNIEVQNEKGMY